MATRMLQRRGTAAEWAAANPVLSNGELGFETDTKVIKLGDGVTPWNSLTVPYLHRSGGTMTGALSLIAPTAAAHAARKQDVDTVQTNVNTVQSNLNTVNTTLTAKSYHDSNQVNLSNGSPSGISTWTNWGTETITFANPGMAVKVRGTIGGLIASIGGVGRRIGQCRVAISLDGGTSFTTGLIGRSETDRGTADIASAPLFAHHLRTGTPTGSVIIKTQLLQDTLGALGDLSWQNGSIIAEIDSA